MKLHHVFLFVHLAGVIVWVGGMNFALFCLRPAAAELSPAERLGLWCHVFRRFFPMVWVALTVIVASGFTMLLEVGFAQAPKAWHAMAGVGLVMAAVFVNLWFGPWRALQQAVAAGNWAQGAPALNAIRQRVALNLALGALNVALATLGLAF